MELFLTIVLFIVGLLLIVKGGDYFVDAASWIAEVSGIPKFIVGATVVSMATTLPELLVSAIGAFDGSEASIAVATGNAVGSVTANTGMILAISILCIPAIIKRSQYVFKALMLVAVTAVLWIFSFSGVFPGGNYLATTGSVILFICFIAFIIENVKSAKKEALSAPKTEVPHGKKDITVNAIKFIVGVIGIVIGARLMVTEATTIAERLGVPAAVISATIVAIGTSLPELVTTITAVVKKESALSVGNIFGANIIDIAVILPVCSLISGKQFPVSAQNLALDMPACLLIILIAIIPMLIRGKFSRVQGGILLTVYLAYVVVITAFLEPVLSFLGA